MSTFLRLMLRKVPAARPSLSRVRAVLQRIRDGEVSDLSPEARAALGRAEAAVAKHEEVVEQKATLDRDKQQQRKSLALDGLHVLLDVAKELFQAISDDTLHTSQSNQMIVGCLGQEPINAPCSLRLGSAELSLKLENMGGVIPEGSFSNSGWDAVLLVTILLRNSKREEERSASIWYAQIPGRDGYRWYETSYRHHPLHGGAMQHAPFALTNHRQADDAAGPGMTVIEITFGPVPIDGEDTSAFIDRWGKLLANAAEEGASRT